MSDYPKDWEVHKVSDFGNVVTGNTPSTSIKEYWNGNYTWITPTDIESQIFMNVSERKLTLSGYNKSRKLRKGAVLVTCIASIGKNCILDVDGSCNQQINAIEVNKKSYNLYIYYLMEFNKKTLENLAGITATKILKKDTFEKIEFTIPPLEEQKAIADTLMIFDKHIENLEKLIEKKKMIRDGAVEDLMTGKTRLDGFDGEWDEIKLNDFTEINPNSSKPNEFYYIDLESVQGKSILNKKRFNSNQAPSRAQRVAKRGDVFFQTVRPYQRNNVLFDLEKNDYVFSSGYAQFRTSNSQKFLFQLIFKDDFVESVLDRCTGTSYPSISPKELGKIIINIPTDIKEQRAIASILTSMDHEIENLENEKAKIEKIKAGAMDDLLTGRVRLV